MNLEKSGWEVGLHYSFGSHIDGRKIFQERQQLEQIIGNSVQGGRCHFLPFEVQVTPFLLGRLNEITGGESLRTNIALVRNNAAVCTKIAVEFFKKQ